MSVINVPIPDLVVNATGAINLEVKIGNAQPGSHTWAGGTPPLVYPPPEGTVWQTTFNAASGSFIKFKSSTRNQNPDTNWVSIVIKVNGVEVADERLQKEVAQDDIVKFTTTLKFSAS